MRYCGNHLPATTSTPYFQVLSSSPLPYQATPCLNTLQVLQFARMTHNGSQPRHTNGWVPAALSSAQAGFHTGTKRQICALINKHKATSWDSPLAPRLWRGKRDVRVEIPFFFFLFSFFEACQRQLLPPQILIWAMISTSPDSHLMSMHRILLVPEQLLATTP